MRSGTFERSLPRYGVTEATALLLRRFFCSAAKPNGMPHAGDGVCNKYYNLLIIMVALAGKRG